MANISFNARHGISVGTLPTQISDNVGNITAGTLTATGVLFGTTLVASADGAPSTTTSLRLRNSAANGQSVFALMPNGTNQITAFRLYNKDDVTGANTGALDIVLQGTSVIFAPWATGTGIAPTTLSIGLATSLSSASGLNISAGPLTVAGSISTSGNLHTNRHRLVFSGGPTDPNHTIYNNYSNLDGEGSWDGMKINAYLGLIVRQTDGSPAWMTVNSAGLIISGTTITSGIFTNWDAFSGLEVRSAAGISRGFFGSESGSSNLRINAVGGITNIYSNSTLITAITPTGIAVTGSMSATGQVFNGYGNTAAIGYSWSAAATTTNSIEIVTGNTVLTTVSPTLSFHRYGSGGPQFRLDPAGSNVLYLESANAGSARGGTAPGGTYFSRLEITGNLTATGVVNVGTDLIVGGNLIVNGTTTTLNTATLDIEDINISLGKVVTPTDVTAVGGGITLLGTTNKTITWNNATAGWEFNQPVTVTGTISGTSIQSTPIGNVTPSTGAFTTLSASGNVIVNTTDPGWAATTRAVHLYGGWASLSSDNTNGWAHFGANVYEDGNNTWRAVTNYSGLVFRGDPIGGAFVWYKAPANGAGGVLTLAQLMALNATGLAVTGSITSTVPAAGAFTTLSATTGTFSSTLGVTGASTFSSGTFSSTLGVTGLITSTGGISGGAASHTTGTFSGAITATTLNGLTPSASIIGSRLVATDVNGYIFGNYFNSTDGGVTSGVTGVMIKATDNYHRTGSAQSIATFLTGTTMNISGSSTSCTGNSASASTVVATSASQTGDGWWRSSGATGWYSTTYAVGIYATETGNVRTYNGANFMAAGSLWESGGAVRVYSPNNPQVNISGNAGTVTNAAFYRQFTVRDDRSDGNDYSLAGRSTGLYAIAGAGTNGPGPTYLSLLHIANGGDVALQVAGGYNGDSLYFRGTAALQNGTQYTPWRTVIHSGNIGSQSVTYSTTAGSITSQANSATITAALDATGNTIALRNAGGDCTLRYLFSSYVHSPDDVSTGALTYLMGKFGDNYHRSATAATVATFLNGSTMNIVGWSTSSPYYNAGTIAGGGGAATHFQFMGNTSSAAGFSLHRAGAYAVNFGLDTDNQLKVGGWSMGNVSYPILHSGNYNSYAPTLSGGGASGTWGINVTGNAASASTVTIYTNRTDAAWYQAMWTTSGGTPCYSTPSVSIYSGPPFVAGYNGGIAFHGNNWQLGAHPSYGLYSNTGLYAASGLWSAVHVNAGTSISSGTGIYPGTDTFYTNNYGYGQVGLYNSTIYQAVFSMGSAYRLGAGGGVGNLYGMCWSYPGGQGGPSGNLDSHGMIVLINGGFGSCMSYSIVASGNVTAYSDERLKTNWKDLPEDFINKLAGVKVGTYDRTDRGLGTQVGVSAQSLREVMPNAVTEADDEMKTLSVSYGNAALASAVMLAREVKELKAELLAVKTQLNTIMTILENKNGATN